MGSARNLKVAFHLSQSFLHAAYTCAKRWRTVALHGSVDFRAEDLPASIRTQFEPGDEILSRSRLGS